MTLGRTSRKCLWCNRPEGELQEVAVMVPDRFGLHRHEESIRVHPAHERDARDFLAFLNRNAKWFLLGVVLVLVLTWTGSVAMLALQITTGRGDLVGGVVLGTAMLGLAVLMWRFPFATPETIRWLGIRRSVQVVRGLAVVIAVFAIWFAWRGVRIG